MKLVFSLLLFTVFQLSASAQYEFGTYYIDANLNFKLSSDHIDDAVKSSSKNNAYTINPEIGYFIKNNLALGIGFNYKNTFISNSSTDYTVYLNTTFDYSLSPTYSTELTEIAPVIFLKYFYQPTKKLSVSLKASYSKGWGTYDLIQKYTKNPQGLETVFHSEKNKIESEYLFLSPELQYLITKRVGVQVNFNGLGYVSTSKYDNYFSFNGYNPSFSTGTITKSSNESTVFNIKPSAWSFGVFVLLN